MIKNFGRSRGGEEWVGVGGGGMGGKREQNVIRPEVGGKHWVEWGARGGTRGGGGGGG